MPTTAFPLLLVSWLPDFISHKAEGRLADQLGPDATIVVVMCDTGMKYLKTYRAKI